jgi:CDP-diacylglycerol--glycerol-3-phosphate 3-phosphatidyltransferase
MIGKAVGAAFVLARDAVARVLLRLRVHPHALTLTGMVITAGAGVCYAIGASAPPAWSFDARAAGNVYLPLAGALLVLASACDMLDGAVARLGKLSTRFGAFLDSTLDRYSDFAVFAGIAVNYACQPTANVTFAFLAMLAFFNAFMISYTRARAEDLIPKCTVGYWQRGERSAAILIATFAYNIPALVLQQALLPMLTALRRVLYTKNVIDGKTPVEDPRAGGVWLKVRLWRYPRMTWAYDLVTAANIAWLLLARIEPVDVFRIWWM